MKGILAVVGGFVVVVSGTWVWLGGGVPVGAVDRAETEDAARATFAPVRVEDAVGDAADQSVTGLSYGPGCRLGGCIGLPAVPLAGEDAAAYDLLAATIGHESADAFTLALEVAEIGDFAHLDVGPVGRVAEYGACWRPGEAAGERCVVHYVHLDDGEARHGAVLLVTADGCNDWGECTFDVASSVHDGRPGSIRFEVPKRLAAIDGAPLDIVELRAWSGWHSANDVTPLWHAAFSVRDGQKHTHDHVGLVSPAAVADDLGPVAVDVDLAAPGPQVGVVGGRVLAATAGTLYGDGGPRDLPWMDVVGLSIEEPDDATLLVRVEVAALDGLPSDGFHHIVFLGVLGGVVHEMGVIRESDGNAFGYAGRCISFGCHDAYADRVPFSVEPGAPGAFVLEVPRAVLFDVVRGSTLSVAWVATSYAEASVYQGEFGDPRNANVHSASVVDGWFGGAPYVFARGADLPGAGERHGHAVGRAEG